MQFHLNVATLNETTHRLSMQIQITSEYHLQTDHLQTHINNTIPSFSLAELLVQIIGGKGQKHYLLKYKKLGILTDLSTCA